MSIRILANYGRDNLRMRGSLQTILLAAFWGLGELISKAAHLPVPGGVVGMIIVLSLLLSRGLPADYVRRGARLFMAELLLFFIPAVLAILDHREFIGILGLKVLAVILTGTVLVMSVTAVAAEYACRWYAAKWEHSHVPE